jgi:hypothetical protein
VRIAKTRQSLKSEQGMDIPSASETQVSTQMLPWRPRRAIVRPIVALVLAALIIGLTMTEAMWRGLDHAVAVSYGEETAIAIALSDMVYHLHLGYVGLASVFNTIQQHWNGSAGWTDVSVLVQNFHNEQILNDGIRAAASLGPQKPGYLADGSLITTIYDDMGEVDFVKLSFAIFGMRIQSLFFTFFLLLAISAVTFILAFRNNLTALALLLCTLFALYVELFLAAFDPVAVPSFFGMRHGSALALVPMWHFMLLLILRRRPSPGLVAGALVQLAILILAWRIRGAAAWTFIFLFFLAFVMALAEWWRTQQKPMEPRRGAGSPRQLWMTTFGAMGTWTRDWPRFLQTGLKWPVVLLLVGMLANGIYNQQSRHFIYSTDDVLPRHGLWWSVVRGHYVGGIYNERVHEGEGTPEGWWYLRDYLDRIHLIPWTGAYTMSEPAPGLTSPWTGGNVKYRMADEAFERIFFEAIRLHPLRVLRVFLDKPPYIIRYLSRGFTNAKSDAWMWLILAAGIGVFGFLLLLEDKGEEEKGESIAPGKAILLAAAAVVVATLPTFLAYPIPWLLTDSMLLLVTLASLTIGMGSYVALGYARQKRQETSRTRKSVPL